MKETVEGGTSLRFSRSSSRDELPRSRLSPEASRELHRKTILLIVLFSLVHLAMLTVRVATIGLEYQAKLAGARMFLTPMGAFLCYAIFRLMHRLRNQEFAAQAVVGAILSVCAALLHGIAWTLFLNNLDAATYASTLGAMAYQSLYWYLYYFSWTTAYLGLSYSITVREQERRFASVLAEAQEAKLRALRYQINPHFLFNTLNSIAELIDENGKQAERMVLSLSAFFRTSLTVDPTEDVTLADEVRLQELYLEIERTRFPHRLHYSVDVPRELANAKVPNLILQPLIENAVKHGVGQRLGRTHIVIYARAVDETLHVSVLNEGLPKGASRSDTGAGIGLQNVRNRLITRYGDNFRMSADTKNNNFVVEITIPLRNSGSMPMVSTPMPFVS